MTSAGARAHGRFLNGPQGEGWCAATPRRLRPGLLASTALAAFLQVPPAGAQTLPTAPQVVSGQVGVSQPSATQMTVTQTSATGIVNWGSFSIGQGYHTHFDNAAGATLNRVTGNLPSSLDGLLTATGSVYLVNPAGIVVGPTGVIQTGGHFVGSTLDIRNEDFLRGGDLTLSGDSTASVVNLGTIGSSRGDVVLVAHDVANHGAISAPRGTAGLASGREVLIRDQSMADGKIAVRVGAPGGSVLNTGDLRAAEAELRANGGNVHALAVNTGGTITATGVRRQGGRVFLTAEGGNVTVSQTIRAQKSAARTGRRTRSAARPRDGGEVRIAADTVALGGRIVAAGRNGGVGGTIVAVASQTMKVTSDARLDASGHVGGFVDTSGAQVRIEDGAQVTTRGANGTFGQWLIDPTDFTIGSGSGALTGSGIGAATLMASLANTSVALATAAAGSEPGDIHVNAPVSWSSGSTLTLTAHNDIFINADITATGDNAGLALNPLAGGYSLNNGARVTLSGANPAFSVNGQSYTVIQNVTQLQAMQDNLSGRYALGVDIDASITATWNGGEGFAPVGDNASRFTGMFDGLGHVVSGLVIDRLSMEHVGLFGYTQGATIRDVGLDGGSVRAWGYVGGLVGYQTGGSIAQSYSTVAVTGMTRVGGLVGQLGGGSISRSWTAGPVTGWISMTGGLVGLQVGGSIDRSWATGAVTGTGSVGGLVGIQSGGSIDRSWVTGAVTGTRFVGGLVGEQNSLGSIAQSWTTGVVAGVEYVGGLVGFQERGSIAQSTATGSVTGTFLVGGLVGWQDGGSIAQSYATGAVTGALSVGGLVGEQNRGSIAQSWATGAVTGTDQVGGLVGLQAGGSISDSFFDTTTTRVAPDLGVGNVANHAGVTAIQSNDPGTPGNYAFNQATYAGLDFSTDWFMIDGETRPFGRWEHSTTIRNAHQLQLMAMDLGASYRLAANIDLGAALDDPASMWKTAASGSAQHGFVPVGDMASRFTGSFDGQGHVVSGLVIDRPTTDYVGLFGFAQNATIADVDLEGVSVLGRNTVGGLVGYLWGGSSITRSTVAGHVQGTERVGGLAGQQGGGSIAQSTATGRVTGYSEIGGLVGYQWNSGSITQSTAEAQVAGSYQVGGLVGFQWSSSIAHSHATGPVSGIDNVGGLAGYQDSGSIAQSWASGAVTGTQNVGGLVGYQDSGSIALSWASGAITGAHNVGGLVGYQWGGSIAQSWATGAVTGTGQVAGGLVGQTGGSIDRSWASGAVTGAYSVGGLVGYQWAGSIDRSSATGAVNGQTYVGGLVGFLVDGSIDRSSAAGAVNGQFQVGGLVGTQRDGSIDRSYATGAVNGQFYVGGLVGSQQGGSIDRSYATGTMSGQLYVGGLVGLQSAGSIAGSFFDTTTTGLPASQGVGSTPNATGVTGLTTAQFQNTAGFMALAQGQGWDFETVWAPPSAGFYPELYALSPVVRVDVASDSRLYGDVNPVAVEAARYGGPAAYVFGPAGDTLAFAAGLQWTAVQTDNVGAYGATGLASADSTGGVTYRIVHTGELTVAPRPIAFSAADGSRLYGDANPALTFNAAIGGSGLADHHATLGDAGFGLATTADAQSDVGGYAITLGATSANYDVTFTGGTLTVDPRALTVTAGNVTKTYGAGFSFAGTEFTAAGLVLGQTIGAVTLESPGADAGAAIGSYAVTASQATGGTFNPANYIISYVDGTLTVMGAPLSLVGPYQTASNPPALSHSATGPDTASDPADDDATACVDGGACQAWPHPDNRRVGPFITFSPAAGP